MDSWTQLCICCRYFWDKSEEMFSLQHDRDIDRHQSDRQDYAETEWRVSDHYPFTCLDRMGNIGSPYVKLS